MTITLPDDPALLQMEEAQVRVELACALFAAGRVSRSVAARIAEMGSFPFDEELFRRQIPTWTEEMLNEDLESIRKRSER